MGFGDLRFALDDGAVLHDCIKSNVFFARGNDTTFDRQNFRRLFERGLHVARDFVHRRDKQIAETVPRQRAVALETILEQLLHERFGISQRDETISQIAGRNDSEFLAQASRTASVIGNGDDGGNIVR